MNELNGSTSIPFIMIGVGIKANIKNVFNEVPIFMQSLDIGLNATKFEVPLLDGW